MVVELIKEAKLVAIRDSTYTMYVFTLLEEKNYVMCTRLPNWQVPEISIGDSGFLKYQTVEAGDQYTTPDGSIINYKYTNAYFLDFIHKTDKLNKDGIIL